MQSDTEIEEQAADWVVRSQAEDFDAHAALADWLRRGADHRSAFERAREAWALLDEGAFAAPSREDDLDERAPYWRLHPGVVAAAAIATCLAILIYPAVSLRMTADYRTAGETEAVRLADGSEVLLDHRTAIKVAYSGSERRLVLLRGQAHFAPTAVGPNEARPFLVQVGDTSVQALGTRFNVNTLGGMTDITAIEHQIAIKVDSAKGTPRILNPGEAVRVRDGTLEEHGSSSALASAWQQSRIIVDRLTLEQAAELLARYSYQPVTLMPGAGGGRQVSAVFDARRSEQAVDAVAAEYGLRVRTLPIAGTIIF
ncbi:FecR family protein [Pacificimonas flava]|uniref:Putative FecR n=1 Tax=Pacificimonas flava TaxID=1234595 RepID=M2U4C0_9SPHN|nr:FecR domain-containing protein [Pacificimonas flava]EMD82852.1 putative FecR [Pacificimonas flava]MBB5279467.1 transmembrane sensor [Pacificimonas flava]